MEVIELLMWRQRDGTLIAYSDMGPRHLMLSWFMATNRNMNLRTIERIGCELAYRMKKGEFCREDIQRWAYQSNHAKPEAQSCLEAFLEANGR